MHVTETALALSTLDLTAAGSLHEVLDAIVAGAAELLGDAVTALRLVDPDDPTTMVMAASFGVSPAIRDAVRRSPVAEGIGGRAISTKQLSFSHDYASSDQAMASFVADGVQASMAAPVLQGDVAVGSLVVASYQPDHARLDRGDQVAVVQLSRDQDGAGLATALDDA